MSIKPTITIGIPAYNEEGNLAHLLEDIKRQKAATYRVKRIIVCSDASTDRTDAIAQSYKAHGVTLVRNAKRKGKAHCLNAILIGAESDVVVFLDADVRVKDSNFIEKLIAPIISGETDLTSARIEEMPTQGLVDRMLKASMDMKKDIFTAYKHGNNIYTCHGRARAFSKKLASKIHFKQSMSEDAYSYLFAIKNGLTYQYVSECSVFYKLPTTLADHEYQSIRFHQSKIAYEKEFREGLAKKEYRLPFGISLAQLTRHLMQDPYLFLYIATVSFLSVKSKLTKRTKNAWRISKSSKILPKHFAL